MRPLSAILLLACVSHGVAAQAAPETDDLVRIAEAFRLAGVVQTAVWPGWDRTPFPVLLVSGDRVFLIGSREAPAGFSAGATRCSFRLTSGVGRGNSIPACLPPSLCSGRLPSS